MSLSRAQQEQDWQEAEELLQSQDVFEGVVTGYNRGGVIVRVGRVRGFVPASQLSRSGRRSRTPKATRMTAGQVGGPDEFKVVEMDAGATV